MTDNKVVTRSVDDLVRAAREEAAFKPRIHTGYSDGMLGVLLCELADALERLDAERRHHPTYDCYDCIKLTRERGEGLVQRIPGIAEESGRTVVSVAHHVVQLPSRLHHAPQPLHLRPSLAALDKDKP